MNRHQQATAFAALHCPGDPLVLYNIWDAGSAVAVARSGARALATGSWSVAAAQGYDDGQQLPLDVLLGVVERIVAKVKVPLSVDFEGAYAVAPEEVEANTRRLIATGAVGANFEDRRVEVRKGLHGREEQAGRIAAMRRAADRAELPFFINARTDLFLQQTDRSAHGGLVGEALERASAYAEAGASGFFLPGLVDPDLIGRVAESCPLPINILASPAAPEAETLASLGVARISHGPFPYRQLMADLSERHRALAAPSHRNRCESS